MEETVSNPHYRHISLLLGHLRGRLSNERYQNRHLDGISGFHLLEFDGYLHSWCQCCHLTNPAVVNPDQYH
jgi:hypothetical protein